MDSKLIEAARRAIEAHPAYDCGSTGDEEMARAAILAFLDAAAGDEGVVEKVADVFITEAREMHEMALAAGDTFGKRAEAQVALEALQYESTKKQARSLARAALSALKGEVKP